MNSASLIWTRKPSQIFLLLDEDGQKLTWKLLTISLLDIKPSFIIENIDRHWCIIASVKLPSLPSTRILCNAVILCVEANLASGNRRDVLGVLRQGSGIIPSWNMYGKGWRDVEIKVNRKLEANYKDSRCSRNKRIACPQQTVVTVWLGLTSSMYKIDVNKSTW